MVEASPVGGVLAVDDTTCPKKGKHSVGVTHQYCGELGKRANCQAFVTAEYTHNGPTSSTPMHWPVSSRLFLPNDWAGDEERRRAHVPAEIEKQSKIGIALELIDRAILWNVLFRLLTADAAYGHFRDFLEGLEERKLVYACAVKCNFGAGRPDEVRAAQNAPPPLGRARLGGRRSAIRLRYTGWMKRLRSCLKRRGRPLLGAEAAKDRCADGSSRFGCIGERATKRAASTTGAQRRARKAGSSPSACLVEMTRPRRSTTSAIFQRRPL